VAHPPQQHWQNWWIPLIVSKITKHFKCKLLSQNANNWIFKQIYPLLKKSWGVSGVLRNSPQNTQPIWEYVLCDYGNGDSRERERSWIFFLINKLKGIYNGYARNVILYIFLALKFANLIRNLLGYYHHSFTYLSTLLLDPCKAAWQA
jgi:hypothetical protein